MLAKHVLMHCVLSSGPLPELPKLQSMDIDTDIELDDGLREKIDLIHQLHEEISNAEELYRKNKKYYSVDERMRIRQAIKKLRRKALFLNA